MGECPYCSSDYSGFLKDADENALIENVMDSKTGTSEKFENKIPHDKDDDLLLQLKKRLVNGDISIEEFYRMRKVIE